MEALLDRKKDLMLEKKSDNKKIRSKYWDIVKAIGIISIVIGHASPNVTSIRFVYTYHLVVFFFVSAYFINEEKYGDNPWLYFANSFKKLLGKYTFYSFIFVVFHNLFVKYNFYFNTPYFSFRDSIVAMLNSMVFQCSEAFASALWFVPALLLTNLIFCIIICYSRKISNKIKEIKVFNRIDKNVIKYICICVISIILGILGVYLNLNKLRIAYFLHTVFLVIPICSVAYLCKNVIEKTKIMKIINNIFFIIFIAIVSSIIIFVCVQYGKMVIELSDFEIINGYMFYIISFIGIAFCLACAKIIEKIPFISKFFSVIGESSFSIMALHFLFIKLVDVIYCYVINEKNPEVIGHWVSSYTDKLFVLYILVGVICPTILAVIYKNKNKIKDRFKEICFKKVIN